MKTNTFMQRLTAPALITTSLVVALAAPISTANAVSVQYSLSGSLAAFKQRVETAIDTSLTKLQQSADSLNVSLNASADSNGLSVSATGPAGSATGSVSSSGATGTVTTTKGATATGSVSSSGASGSVTGANGNSASGSVTSDSANAQINATNTAPVSLKDFVTHLLSVPKDLKQKLQTVNQKAIDQLKTLKTEVDATTTVQDLQAKAQQYDQEFKQIATANVQATVTKSIDDLTQVLDKLQTAENALQSQATKLKECIEKGSVAADAEFGSASVNVNAPKCAQLNVDLNSGDNGAFVQSKLDEIHQSMATIKSFLTNSINLVGQLKEDDNYNGTLTSFKGISAQLDIVANLSGNVQNDLLNLSAAVNKS